MSSCLSGITTWYSGKPAAIKAYIDPVKKTVFAAGNSEGDIEMIHYAETTPGMTLMVTEEVQHRADLIDKIPAFTDKTGGIKTGLLQGGWLFVTPDRFSWYFFPLI